MKQYIIMSLVMVLSSSLFAQSNNTDGNTTNSKSYNVQTTPEITFDGKSPFDEMYLPAPQVRSLDNILWKKTVWRMIDMREQINFPLYYPLKESNGRTNLFLSIFNLLKEGKVNAYDYNEAKEDFSDEKKLSFEEVMEVTRVEVFETTTNDAGETIYDISEVDIPSADVKKFYIKEVWYFDAIESCMKFKIEAIAPQLYYTDQDGKEGKAVLYWIPFDQLRPWLAQQPVVINNKNATSSISYDDLFQKRRFSGHIYKEDNIQNRTLIQYCNTPDEVRQEQIRIENEILNFEVDLWEY